MVTPFGHHGGALRDALASYDDPTFQHSTRVAANAERLGRHVGLTDEQLHALRWATLLHDIGKLAVPVAILAKDGPLTRVEWEQVAVHPAVGANVVAAIAPGLEMIADAIRTHHERWDGSGYPNRVRGSEIPILGRIVAIIDVHDALTSDRNYRVGRFSNDEALEIISRARGTHFDPDLVDAFVIDA